MNRTVKYQGAFSRIMRLAGKRFLFSPPPPPPFFFAPAVRNNSIGNACYAGYQVHCLLAVALSLTRRKLSRKTSGTTNTMLGSPSLLVHGKLHQGGETFSKCA